MNTNNTDAADQEGLLVKEQPLTEHDGLIRGSRIAIRKDIETQAEKSCVLAEKSGIITPVPETF